MLALRQAQRSPLGTALARDERAVECAFCARVSRAGLNDDGMSMLKVERRAGCVWLTLDRPPLNLFTPELIERLRDTFVGLRRGASVRAAVITGAGPVLSAGMQLQELRDL